jgi:FkbM family methyltransferase
MFKLWFDSRELAIIIPVCNASQYISFISDAWENTKWGIDPIFILDTRSSDKTEEILLDKKCTLVRGSGTKPCVESLLSNVLPNLEFRWLLRFDDDEFPSVEMLNWISNNLSTVKEPVVSFPRQWVGYQEGGGRWNAARYFEGSYDHQYRLFRPHDVGFTDEIHTPGILVEKYLKADDSAILFHLDWVLRSKQQREEKIKKYDHIRAGAGTNFSKYYLPENYESDSYGYSSVDDIWVLNLLLALREGGMICKLGSCDVEKDIDLESRNDIAPAGDVTRVQALHPHWNGYLKLSSVGGRVAHENHASVGRYELSGSRLTILWDRFQPDVFHAYDDVYVHEDLLSPMPKLEQLFMVSLAGTALRVSAVSVRIPGSKYYVTLRVGSSDLPTFGQIFLSQEYQSPHLPDTAETIVDLGANAGFAAVFFGLKYPQARILALEPEPSNYSAAIGNVAALGSRVQTLLGAVWAYDGWINLHTHSATGESLDAWGCQVSEVAANAVAQTRCYRLETLLQQAEFEVVDILKVDIGGAELELFATASYSWLPKVKLVIVETHDRFRPGSEAAVRNALAADFEELPRQGENLFFRRRV